MKPTIGRIVIYTATEEDRKKMQDGNNRGICNIQQLPAIIVCVWSDTCLNLQVFLDGVGTIWKTSIQKGDGESQWNFPVIQK